MRKKLTILLCFLCSTVLLIAQNTAPCGIPVNNGNPKKNTPIREQSPKDKTITSYIDKYPTIPCQFNIPVIIHVMHYPGETTPNEGTSNPTDEYLESIIEAFNSSMVGFQSATGCKINFCPALYDDENQTLPTPGIERIELAQSDLLTLFGTSAVTNTYFESSLMPSHIWDPSKYLNVWMMPNYFYYTIGQGLPSNVFGVAYFPQYPNLPGVDIGDDVLSLAYRSDTDRDGIILNTFSIPSSPATVQHELGHWLGANHTFGNVNSCNYDDHCADTGLCTATTGCTNQYTCGEPDPIKNFMSYTSCRNSFTPCQYQRFYTSLTNDYMRYSITQNSHLCRRSTEGTAVVSQPYDVLCIGDEFQWSDYIDVFVPAGTEIQYSWSTDNGESWSFFQTDPTLIAASNVSYLIQVAIVNDNGTLTILNTVEFDMWVILDCNWPPNDDPVPYPDDKYDTFRVFPNPAMNQLKVASNETIESIEVFDLLFREQSIITRDFDNIDISKYSDGILFVKVKFENGIIQTSKVIKAAN